MSTRTTTTKNPAGQAKKALEERRARRAAAAVTADVTIEQRAVAATMRDRDHAEACPAPAGRIEAYGDRVIAPGPDLRGSSTGDIVIVVRCHECGRLRYFTGYEKHQTPEAARDAFIDDQLAKLAGDDDADLDETLE
jgi:hypothetical protein